MQETLAIEGGTPVRSAPFPAWPQWTEEEERALLETLRSGVWWSYEGSQVKAFEEEFAAYHDAAYGVACTNGSAALEVCLRAAGIDWGDEVITTPYTFIATANACLLVGAIPRFADVSLATWNLDPERIEALITPRTKAILPVHLGGEPADMDAIQEIAARYGLIVIEDACQAHGAVWRNRKVGSLGDMGCFSFQNSKNITAGEGGMVVTNSAEWADKCWSVVNVGRGRGGAFYEHIGLASNYRMVEWSAAVLRVQLKRLQEQTERRAANAAYLDEALSEVPGLTPVRSDPRTTLCAYHLYRLIYDPAAFGGRSAGEFARAMRAEGIPIALGYPEPLSQQEVIVKRSRFIRERLGLPQQAPDPTPACEHVCTHGLWMPQRVLLGSREDMEDIMTAVRKVHRAWHA
ncbi:MAG: DegT/DnrJ/EryC1/StrS family aminotransferase [Chloroflexi bacterium]|nr:DegT/DnrJ/EryC1/StrS family aminotransferase [Chloroflexota bacterium]